MKKTLALAACLALPAAGAAQAAVWRLTGTDVADVRRTTRPRITPAISAGSPPLRAIPAGRTRRRPPSPAVRVPGTVMPLGSGLAGLVGLARFRRKRSAG